MYFYTGIYTNCVRLWRHLESCSCKRHSAPFLHDYFATFFWLPLCQGTGDWSRMSCSERLGPLSFHWHKQKHRLRHVPQIRPQAWHCLRVQLHCARSDHATQQSIVQDEFQLVHSRHPFLSAWDPAFRLSQRAYLQVPEYQGKWVSFCFLRYTLT